MATKLGLNNIDKAYLGSQEPSKIALGDKTIKAFFDVLEANKTTEIQTEIDNYNQRLTDLNVTRAEYENLTEYENRRYLLDDGAIYDGATLVQRENYVFGVNDLYVSTSISHKGLSSIKERFGSCVMFSIMRSIGYVAQGVYTM